MVSLIDFGSRVDPDVWGTPGFANGDLGKTLRFGPFLPVLNGSTNSFWVGVDAEVWGTAGSG
jgi:hypothetical protein